MECLIYSFVLYIQHLQKTAFTYMPNIPQKNKSILYYRNFLFYKTNTAHKVSCRLSMFSSLPNINRKFISDIWATYLAFVWPNVFVTKYFFMKYVTRHQIAKHTIKTLFSYTSSLSMIAEKQQVLHHPVDFQSTHQTLHLNLPFSL